jgi:hypothetical protein
MCAWGQIDVSTLLDSQVKPNGDPYLHLATARGEVRLLLGGEDPNTVENIDGFISLDDGTTRTFTALTLAEVDRAMKKWEHSGECLAGGYFQVPDLIIIRVGGIKNVLAAVEDAADELPAIELYDSP